MTTPRQQLDEADAVRDAKLAEQGKLIGQLLQSLDAFGARLQDVESEQATHAEIIYDLLQPAEPTPEPEPEPQPEPDPPAPEPTPRIDKAPLEGTHTVGTTVSVPVVRIADGQTLFWHVFSSEWKLLHAKNVGVVNSQVTVTIPNHPGPVKLQLQYGDTEKQTVDATIVAAPSEPEPTPTPTPTGNYEALARWNVAPEQQLQGSVGVVAHHLYGIARVDFQVDGGAWQSVHQPAINPQTETDEYWIEVDSPSEVRAIAVPHKGIPRELEPLRLNRPEVIVELPAGEVDAQSLVRQCRTDGWTIFRGNDTTLIGGSRGWKGHVKFESLTWKPGAGGGMAMAGSAPNDWIWLDDVNIIGNGRDRTTSWTTHQWGRSIFTDCDITQVQNIFHGTAGQLLARNVTITDCYEDVFRAMGLAVNITIDGIDRGNATYHPAVWSFQGSWTQRNVIYQNIQGTNITSQGLAGSNVGGLAVVDCNMRLTGNTAFLMHSLRNVLIQDSNLIGGGQFQDKGSFAGVVFRNSKVGYREPFLPAGWERDGVTVL